MFCPAFENKILCKIGGYILYNYRTADKKNDVCTNITDTFFSTKKLLLPYFFAQLDRFVIGLVP
jgi:hypothetical protein